MMTSQPSPKLSSPHAKTNETISSSSKESWSSPLLRSMNPFALLDDAKEPKVITLKEFLMEFYAEKNPDKLNDVDQLVEYYTGRELSLLAELDKRYGTKFQANPPFQVARSPNEYNSVSKAPLPSTASPKSAATSLAAAKVKSVIHKVILLGNSGVGKTNLLSRLNTGEFSEEFCSTIGVEFLTHAIDVDGMPVKAQIWDTAGQERFNAMMSTYYRKAVGAMLVYDVSDPTSLASVKDWLEQLLNVADPTLQTILVGNKCDLTGDLRKVSTLNAKVFASTHKMMYIETSAKTGENVEKAFRDLLSAIHRSQATATHPESIALDLNGRTKHSSDECC